MQRTQFFIGQHLSRQCCITSISRKLSHYNLFFNTHKYVGHGVMLDSRFQPGSVNLPSWKMDSPEEAAMTSWEIFLKVAVRGKHISHFLQVWLGTGDFPLLDSFHGQKTDR